jgi:hypothetical protein
MPPPVTKLGLLSKARSNGSCRRLAERRRLPSSKQVGHSMRYLHQTFLTYAYVNRLAIKQSQLVRSLPLFLRFDFQPLLHRPQTTGVIPSVANEEAYMNLLNSKCSELKSLTPLGGVGWFWNIWSDKMLGGWGFLDSQGNPKFDFKPIVSC